MRSTWPVFSATVVLGVGLGTWIAGVPRSDGSVSVAAGGSSGALAPAAVPGIDPTLSTGVDPFAPAPSGSPAPAPTMLTGSAAVPTAQPALTTVPAETAPEVTAPIDTTPIDTTPIEPEPAETAPAVTAPAETAPAATAAPELVDRSQVRLVVGNGDGRWNLVGANVARLEPLGYTEIDQTDLPRSFDRTILYVRPGFEDEAVRLAADLLVPGALIEPLPATPVTANDELGDIIVVLGADAIR